MMTIKNEGKRQVVRVPVYDTVASALINKGFEYTIDEYYQHYVFTLDMDATEFYYSLKKWVREYIEASKK